MQHHLSTFSLLLVVAEVLAWGHRFIVCFTNKLVRILSSSKQNHNESVGSLFLARRIRSQRRIEIILASAALAALSAHSLLGARPGSHAGRNDESASQRIGSINELIERVMKAKSIFAASSLGR